MSQHDRGTGHDPHSLPLADYDELPLPALESRIRPLGPAEVRELLDHERRHARRTGAVEVLKARLGQLKSGSEPSSGDPSAPRPGAGHHRGGSPVSPATSSAPGSPPPHGTPDQPGRPKGNRA
ncbi:hypothetical protein GCM10018793_47590 [Streptomyces sulfonofaciens]|uniref:DUF8129 domain-containing protein n=1 Tax=Streptomyces sulfonofaciens TaxID=68272 RepID=A0A919GGS7_9ACTN|nr:hypothetical protein [Streptomyces sulfonofaciens]GHH84096.1 hypothetical protein GCM10018793_47590 [Streptomyces sulfonofaciens]